METQQHGAATIAPIKAKAPGLEGLSGRVRIDIAGRTVGTLTIAGADVQVDPADPGTDADAAFRFASTEDLVRLLRGELNPVVGWLQDRLEVEGDPVLSVKVILGLQVPSELKGQALVQEGG